MELKYPKLESHKNLKINPLVGNLRMIRCRSAFALVGLALKTIRGYCRKTVAGVYLSRFFTRFAHFKNVESFWKEVGGSDGKLSWPIEVLLDRLVIVFFKF